MVKKIIYPRYAMWVYIYTILFATSSILYGKLIDYLVIKYDDAFIPDGDKKTKARLIFEVCIELGFNSVGVYVFRELITFVIRYYFKIEKNPDAFATLVVAPIIFSQQPRLMQKIKEIFK